MFYNTVFIVLKNRPLELNRYLKPSGCSQRYCFSVFIKNSTFQFHQKNKVNLLFFQRAPRPRLEVSYRFLFPIFAKLPETLSLIISDILAYYKDYGHLISIDFMQSNRSYSSLKLRKPSKISSKMQNFYMLAWREDPLNSLDDHDQLV